MTPKKNEELPQDLHKEFLRIAVIQGIKKNNLSKILLQKIEQDPSLLDKHLPHGKTWAHLACRSGAAQHLPKKCLTAETLLQKDTRKKTCPLQIAQKTKKLYQIQKNLRTETLRAILQHHNTQFLTPPSKKSLAKQIKKNEIQENLSQANHPSL
jgi:hypothetical protein